MCVCGEVLWILLRASTGRTWTTCGLDGVGSEMGDCRVEGYFDGDGGACRLRKQQPALQGCEGGQGKMVGVGVGSQLPGDHHGPERVNEEALPLFEDRHCLCPSLLV